MASSLQHFKESKISEYENMYQYEPIHRDSRWNVSMESATAISNKANQTNMVEVIRKEVQESRRANDDSEIRNMTSEIPRILVGETLEVREEQTFNNAEEGHTDPVLICGDSANTSTLGGRTSNCGSSAYSSDAWTETTSPETSSILSGLSYEDNSLEESSPPSENQVVLFTESSIPLSSSELHLQQLEPSTSVLSPSTNGPSSEASDVNASDLDILTPASTMDRPQSHDQTLTSQLWESQFAGGVLLSPLMHIPPPPYTEQPPCYEATERTCSVTTVSELQRAGPLTLEMPPSYDATREADRLRTAQDLRQRSSTASDWNKKNFLCCVSFAIIMFIGLAALGMSIR